MPQTGFRWFHSNSMSEPETCFVNTLHTSFLPIMSHFIDLGSKNVTLSELQIIAAAVSHRSTGATA